MQSVTGGRPSRLPAHGRAHNARIDVLNDHCPLELGEHDSHAEHRPAATVVLSTCC
jgi:hypothetical protein